MQNFYLLNMGVNIVELVLGISTISYKHRFLEKTVHRTDYCISVFESSVIVYCCNRNFMPNF